ncbi:hypothetical protein C8Q79DRAFT_1014055 [Trametes meyenii]|nr:hypothetical protein C8Q79DRAFT_1014055 [Trametes meyenii]
MPSASTESVEQSLIAREFFFVQNCVNFVLATLIFYEYLITFEDEFRLIWRGKLTGASVIFVLNRYIMVVQNAITMASVAPLPNTVGLWLASMSCAVLGYMDVILSILPYVVWNAFSTLRVYAISGRDWRVSSVVCVLMLGPLVSNIYDAPVIKPVNMPPPYLCSASNGVLLAVHYAYVPFRIVPALCYNNTLTSMADPFGLMRSDVLVLGSRCPLIAGDALVLAVTWRKTYRVRKMAEGGGVRTPLLDLLLRDGTIYFGTMLLLNVLHILITFVQEVSVMGDVADVLTAILVSRFILNLREYSGKGIAARNRSHPHDTQVASVSANASGARSTLVFASRIVGSLGESLGHSASGESEAESESFVGEWSTDEGNEDGDWRETGPGRMSAGAW